MSYISNQDIPGDFGLLHEGKPTLDNAKEFYHVANGILTLVCHKVGISQEELLT